MCGITGAFSPRDLHREVDAMTRAVAHRGPDDVGLAGICTSREISCGTFGHRRLAILDLTSAGHQPMATPDSRITTTYNGEIYNFPALRKLLESEGIEFHTECDTELILLGWRKYGPDFLKELRGMFALAIWDSEKRRGYLARDGFGIKPLYVAARGDSVLFASEVRALVASGLVERKLSAPALRSFLCTGSVAEPFTIVDGVFAIPPGCIVEVDVDEGGARIGATRKFDEPFTADAVEPVPFSQSAFQLRNALRESVRRHLLSDVPVAMFLSGGLDSSAVVGIATELSKEPLESFTVTFAEGEYNEGDVSRLAAQHFGTNHHEIPLSWRDLLDALPAAFKAMDQPSLDGLNTYVVSRAVSDAGIKVVLSGLGGDELFGGYPSFRRAMQIAPLWKFPWPIRSAVAAGAFAVRGLRGEKMRMLMKGRSPAAAAYQASRTLFDDRNVDDLLAFEKINSASPISIESNHSGLSLIQEVSWRELSGYMRNTLLRDSDVFSMAHGLELRVPFLDRAVARVAANAADSAKIGGSGPKPLLVAAVGDLLPEALLSRPKRGFTLPFETWMRADLAAEVQAMFTGANAERVGLRTDSIREVWARFQGRRHGMTWSRPWAIYTLLRWARENDFNPPSAAELDEAEDLVLAQAG